MSTDKLTKETALALVEQTHTDGLFLIQNLPALSLPFVVRKGQPEEKPQLLGHYMGSREDFSQALREPNAEARVVFQIGYHYVDPSIIPRQPHAPTEIKAVFEFRGKAGIVEIPSREETMEMMAQVLQARQKAYCPESSWTLDKLPNSYADPLLKHISLFTVNAEELHVSQLMILGHLNPEHRDSILGKVTDGKSLEGEAAAGLVNRLLK